MTGRRLYDHYCDAIVAKTGSWLLNNGRVQPEVAWPFLTDRERNIWNDTARRITPKPKPKAK